MTATDTFEGIVPWTLLQLQFSMKWMLGSGWSEDSFSVCCHRVRGERSRSGSGLHLFIRSLQHWDKWGPNIWRLQWLRAAPWQETAAGSNVNMGGRALSPPPQQHQQRSKWRFCWLILFLLSWQHSRFDPRDVVDRFLPFKCQFCVMKWLMMDVSPAPWSPATLSLLSHHPTRPNTNPDQSPAVATTITEVLRGKLEKKGIDVENISNK